MPRGAAGFGFGECRFLAGLWVGTALAAFAEAAHTSPSATRAGVLHLQSSGEHTGNSSHQLLQLCVRGMRNQSPSSHFHPVLKYLHYLKGRVEISFYPGNAIYTHPTRACLIHPSAQELGLLYLSFHENQKGREPSAGSPDLASQGTGSWEGSIGVLSLFDCFSGARLAKCSLRLSH